jgi:hypothetical protein
MAAILPSALARRMSPGPHGQQQLVWVRGDGLVQRVDHAQAVAGGAAVILVDRRETGEDLGRHAALSQARQIDMAQRRALRQGALACQHIAQRVAVAIDDDGVEVQRPCIDRRRL